MLSGKGLHEDATEGHLGGAITTAVRVSLPHLQGNRAIFSGLLNSIQPYSLCVFPILFPLAKNGLIRL